MDVLIKRKSFEEIIKFLNENSQDSDWKILLEGIVTDVDLIIFIKNYLEEITCPLRLALFLKKIFEYKINCKNYQEKVYDILLAFNVSESTLKEYKQIKNILLIQIVKIAHLDVTKRGLVLEILDNNFSNFDDWFLSLLDNFEFYEELGLYYLKIKDYNKSIEYFNKCKKYERLEEIKNFYNNFNIK